MRKFELYKTIQLVLMLLLTAAAAILLLREEKQIRAIPGGGALIFVILAFIARLYYQANWPGERWVTIVLNVLATVAVVSSARLLLLQTGVTDFSAGLSLSLAAALL